MKSGFIGVFLCVFLAAAMGRSLNQAPSFTISTRGSSGTRTPAGETMVQSETRVETGESVTVSEQSSTGDASADSESTQEATEETEGKVDVYCLIDVTEKDTAYITELKGAAESIVDMLFGASDDLRIGVGTYEDTKSDSKFTEVQGFTKKSKKATDALANLPVVDASVAKESQLYALEQVATRDSISFRQKATKIVVWIGNGQGEDPIKDSTEESATQALTGGGIHVIAINTGKLNKGNQARSIVSATSGIFYKANDDGKFDTVSLTDSSDDGTSTATVGGTGDVVVATTVVEGETTTVTDSLSLEDAIIDSVFALGF